MLHLNNRLLLIAFQVYFFTDSADSVIDRETGEIVNEPQRGPMGGRLSEGIRCVYVEGADDCYYRSPLIPHTD